MIRKFQNSKFDFKIYDVTRWLTNNYNTHIAQYLTKLRQPDNWSVYREINVTRKIFFFKNHAENEAGTLVPELFSFVK